MTRPQAARYVTGQFEGGPLHVKFHVGFNADESVHSVARWIYSGGVVCRENTLWACWHKRQFPAHGYIARIVREARSWGAQTAPGAGPAPLVLDSLLNAIAVAANALDQRTENLAEDMEEYVTKDGVRTAKPLPTVDEWPNEEEVDAYMADIAAAKVLAAWLGDKT